MDPPVLAPGSGMASGNPLFYIGHHYSDVWILQLEGIFFLTFALEPPLTDIIKCMENLHSRKCLIPLRLQCCFLLKWSSGQRCQGDVLLFAKLMSFSIMHSRTGYRFDQFELMCWFTPHVMAWIINFSTSDSPFKHLWSNGLVILNWISHACLCSVMHDYGFHMQLRLKHPMPLCAAWLRMDVA